MSYLTKAKSSLFGAKETLLCQAKKVGNSVTDAFSGTDTAKGSKVLGDFVEGAVVILISKNSGKILQISNSWCQWVRNIAWLKKILEKVGKEFDINAKGLNGEKPDICHWVVEDLGDHVIRLHNQNRYLVVEEGQVKTIIHDAESLTSGGYFSTRLTVSISEHSDCSPNTGKTTNYILLECATEPGKYITIQEDGSLSTSLSIEDIEATQFEVLLISKPELINPKKPAIAKKKPKKK